MNRLFKQLALFAMLCMIVGGFSGCAPFSIPRIDPTGNRLFTQGPVPVGTSSVFQAPVGPLPSPVPAPWQLPQATPPNTLQPITASPALPVQQARRSSPACRSRSDDPCKIGQDHSDA